MKIYGADALFLAPEYLGSVNAGGAAITGVAAGVFIMSWNITTFILHSRRYRFLATTTKPFLKYCINNSIIPLAFLLYYFIQAMHFDVKKELIPTSDFFLIAAGFGGGFFLLIAFSFAYFFTAERRIIRTLTPVIEDENKLVKERFANRPSWLKAPALKVGYYINAKFKFRKARDVSHYGEDFLDMVFKRHHFSAVLSIILAFMFMILVGFFLDNKFFQVPAAASIIIFFALMIAVIGSLAYFLQSWSVLFVIVLLIVLNILYQYDIIDPRNKAYGINYAKNDLRPAYTKANILQLCAQSRVDSDKANMLTVLNNWKSKQQVQKPVMIFLNFSGGGVRSASFAMNVLQHLDSITNGTLMQKTFLISGASGGMLSACYFRELYRNKMKGAKTNLQDIKYLDNISGDLLNPIFSSMIARDLLSPAQKFSIGPYRYVKDRGYAFEQKLNANTEGILDKQLSDYIADERAANIPMIIFNSVITRDGRKLMISSQPISFMMQSVFNNNEEDINTTDAVDFGAMFSKQDAMNIRILTALRMNATFPYVLPNVWLPSNPIVDVMDAGLRDNFGQETSLRFINVFKDWIKENTGGIFLIQVRDRSRGGWEKPFETGDISDLIIKPATMLQHNWYKLQDYAQNDQIAYTQNFSDSNFHRITFMYVPEKEENGAALNFHLIASEKKEIIASMKRANNIQAFEQVKKFIK